MGGNCAGVGTTWGKHPSLLSVQFDYSRKISDQVLVCVCRSCFIDLGSLQVCVTLL